MAKYRQQMKRLNLNIDKCYRMYDEQDVRYVFKNDFVDISLAIGFVRMSTACSCEPLIMFVWTSSA